MLTRSSAKRTCDGVDCNVGRASRTPADWAVPPPPQPTVLMMLYRLAADSSSYFGHMPKDITRYVIAKMVARHVRASDSMICGNCFELTRRCHPANFYKFGTCGVCSFQFYRCGGISGDVYNFFPRDDWPALRPGDPHYKPEKYKTGNRFLQFDASTLSDATNHMQLCGWCARDCPSAVVVDDPDFVHLRTLELQVDWTVQREIDAAQSEDPQLAKRASECLSDRAIIFADQVAACRSFVNRVALARGFVQPEQRTTGAAVLPGNCYRELRQAQY
jgi:hypothetical protein